MFGLTKQFSLLILYRGFIKNFCSQLPEIYLFLFYKFHCDILKGFFLINEEQIVLLFDNNQTVKWEGFQECDAFYREISNSFWICNSRILTFDPIGKHRWMKGSLVMMWWICATEKDPRYLARYLPFTVVGRVGTTTWSWFQEANSCDVVSTCMLEIEG